MRKRKVAVFDIDGTIFRSSLVIELVNIMIGRGIFSENIRRSYLKEWQAWLNRKGDYENYINALIKVFVRNIRGRDKGILQDPVRELVKVYKNRVYRHTRDLVESCKRKGFFLLAISHSPKYVAETFGKALGFDKIYGTLLELDAAGRFTGGVLAAELIANKAKILERAVEKENLTLRGSVGVGDTETDIGFLKMVDHPICFNPNKKLLRAAKRNGWPVIVERKDVVLKIKT